VTDGARNGVPSRALTIAAGAATVGALAGAVNWAVGFTSSSFARSYLAALVVLGGAVGFAAGLAIAAALMLVVGRGPRGSSLKRRTALPGALRRAWAALLGIGLAAAAAYLGSAPRFAPRLSEGPPGAAAEASQRPNVILVSLDTVRPDHLGAYGYPRPVSPNFDALAATGTLFRRCVAASSWTIPSHAAILTGTAPSHIGASVVFQSGGGDVRLPEEAVTLAEVFRSAGYHTAAFIGGATMRAVFGFDQGFDIFNDRMPPSLSGSADRIFLGRPVRRLLGLPPARFLRFLDPPFLAASNFLYAESQALPSERYVAIMKEARRYSNNADEVNQKVFAWLDRRPSRPFFLFVHYFDPHDPYEPPPEFQPPGYDASAGFILKNGLAERVLNARGALTPSERETLLAGYDGEIAAMDHHFGLLLDRLRAEGALDNAVTAVVSDHGESFGEHGLVFHGHDLYDDLLRSVLVLSGPGVPRGRVEALPVAGMDVAPTLLDLAGLDRPGAAEGRTLGPLLSGQRLDPVPLISEVFGRTLHWPAWEVFRKTRFSVEKDGLKLIRDSRGSTLLFDLASDPGELADLAASRPEAVAALSALLDAYVARSARAPADEGAAPGEEALENLRGLGYIQQ